MGVLAAPLDPPMIIYSIKLSSSTQHQFDSNVTGFPFSESTQVQRVTGQHGGSYKQFV